MMPLNQLLAETLIRERQEAIDRESHEARFSDGRPSVARRALAIGFASISRGSAAAVRRLDACQADDLVAGLASGGSARA
jgi:hypothetical protein